MLGPAWQAMGFDDLDAAAVRVGGRVRDRDDRLPSGGVAESHRQVVEDVDGRLRVEPDVRYLDVTVMGGVRDVT